MGPYEWALIFAVAGILAVGGWQWTRPANDEQDEQAAWDASTAVRRDVADAKARLEIAELYEIWPDPPRSARQIPHQTRRTEENQ